MHEGKGVVLTFAQARGGASALTISKCQRGTSSFWLSHPLLLSDAIPLLVFQQ